MIFSRGTRTPDQKGRLKEGGQVVLLDDVITGAVVLVDREQGGRSELKTNGIDFAAAMTLSGIAKYALTGRLAGVTQTRYDELIAKLDPNELGM